MWCTRGARCGVRCGAVGWVGWGVGAVCCWRCVQDLDHLCAGHAPVWRGQCATEKRCLYRHPLSTPPSPPATAPYHTAPHTVHPTAHPRTAPLQVGQVHGVVLDLEASLAQVGAAQRRANHGIYVLCKAVRCGGAVMVGGVRGGTATAAAGAAAALPSPASPCGPA